MTAPEPPEPDADSAAFWAGLRDELVLLQRCTACERFRFPPMRRCPYCRCTGSHLEAASGAGNVYSWVVVHRAFQPAFAADVPYTVATVDLAEGPRIAVRAEGAVGFDAQVRAAFVHHEDWTELRVVPDA